MEGSSWCPEAVGSSEDWRKQLLPEARQRIVNKIMDTLKRHLPVSAPEGLNELKKIAERFEEKIYIAAINQSDYLRKISLKMLCIETKTQGAAAINPSLSNPTIGNQRPSESGGDVTQHSKKQKIRKEMKEKVNRKIQKPKSRLPSTLHPNQKDAIQQSIPSLLQQLINAIGEQQQGPASPPVSISRQPVLGSQQLRDQIAELQSRLQSLENVVHDLCRCIPLLEKQLEIEKCSMAKMKSAIEAMEIQEASARDEQNVSTAILQRELSNFAKAASSLRG